VVPPFITDEAATMLAAKLKTPLQIGRHLVRAFEAGFEAGARTVDAATVETVLSRRIDDLEPQLIRMAMTSERSANNSMPSRPKSVSFSMVASTHSVRPS
jgi:hypothetical protein